jgi:hypothetical protein
MTVSRRRTRSTQHLRPARKNRRGGFAQRWQALYTLLRHQVGDIGLAMRATSSRDSLSEKIGSHFQMKLQPIKGVTIPKELVWRKRGGPEAHTAGRNIENIPMPMRGDKRGRHSSPERIVARDGIERDLKKTHLWISRLDPCSQSQSHELSAEAQAEDRFSDAGGVADEGAFAREIRIPFLLVRPLRTSTHHEPRKAIKFFWHQLAEIGSNDIESKANFYECFAKETRSVNVAMLDKQDSLVSHKTLPRTCQKRRKRGSTVRQFTKMLRLEIARFNIQA